MVENHSFKLTTIDPKQIIKNDKHTVLVDYILCSECNFIFSDPKECSVCKVTYCSSCIGTEITKSKYLKLKCPKLCSNASFSVPNFVINLLSKLEFNCLRGCGKLISYDDYLRHNNSCSGMASFENCPTCDSKVNKSKIRRNNDSSTEIRIFKEKEISLNQKIEQLIHSNTLLNSKLIQAKGDEKMKKEQINTSDDGERDFKYEKEQLLKQIKSQNELITRKEIQLKEMKKTKEEEIIRLNSIIEEQENENIKLKLLLSETTDKDTDSNINKGQPGECLIF